MAKKKRWSEASKAMMKLTLQAMDRAYYLESLGFSCFPWQKAVLDSRAKRIAINGARQSGKSTIVSAVPAHTARFYPGSISVIGAPTEKMANETMLKVLSFIRLDPDYPELVKSSTEEVQLENGSRIIVRSTNPSTFRGYSKPRVIILDEASRVEDEAYTSGARPMLTDNPEGEMWLISTPNGREGFFYRAMSGDGASDSWERMEIRSPWSVAGTGSESHLEPYMSEIEFQEEKSKEGIRAWFSPRHMDLDFQEEQLSEMGPMQYRQEYCCEFVERAGQVFSYDEIALMFNQGKGKEPFKARETRLQQEAPRARRFSVTL